MDLNELRKEAVKKHTQAMVDGNVEILDEVLHPNWVNDPVQFSEGEGVQGFKNKSMFLFENFKFSFEHIETIVMDNVVVLRSVCHGEIKSDLMGPPNKGKKATFNVLEYHKFEGDKIIESYHLQDYYAMLVQFGVIENLMNATMDPYPVWK